MHDHKSRDTDAKSDFRTAKREEGTWNCVSCGISVEPFRWTTEQKGGNTYIMETIEQYWGLACKNLAPQNAHNLQKIADNKGLKKIKRDGEVTQVSEREQWTKFVQGKGIIISSQLNQKRTLINKTERFK